MQNKLHKILYFCNESSNTKSIMRRILLTILASGALLWTACDSKSKKDDVCPELSVEADSADIAALHRYVEDAQIDATYDPRGFYYVIHEPGNEKRPGFCGSATVNYAGRFTSGVEFDSGNNSGFNMEMVIHGFRYGLNLIGEGGSITLIIPPSLGYGNDDTGAIPGGSILIFDVDVVSISTKK